MGFRAFAENGVLARLAILAFGLLLGYAADAWIFDGLTKSPTWQAIEWTGIVVPLLLILGLPAVSLPGWQLTSSKPRGHARRWAAMWVLCSIILPWILAWLMADATGRWSAVWWTQATSQKLPLDLLIAEYGVVWVVTYGAASVVGFLVTFLTYWIWESGRGQWLTSREPAGSI